MSSSRDAIHEAASRLFRERGYARTSVRDIAGEAGVDPALVIRHFGGKEPLFLDTVALEAGAMAFDGPRESLGERFIAELLAQREGVRDVFLALVRASDADGVASRLRTEHEQHFVEPFRALLDGPDADLRARLAAAVVGGLLHSLWVVGDEGLLTADRDALTARAGALLQSRLDG